jgi:hypothetical protein
MNDQELRGRFGTLVDRVPPNADALPLVRTRAVRLRRRRSTAVVAGLVVVVAAAVVVPETLQHQAKPSAGVLVAPTPSTATTAVSTAPAEPDLANACTPALTSFGRVYGEIQHFYGIRASAEEAVSWEPQVASFAALPAGQTLDFCLIVGNLDNLSASSPPGAGELHMHYAVLADSGAGPVLVSASVNPYTSPLPRTVASQIAVFSPSAAPPTPVASAAIELPPCTSDNVSGVLREVGLVDGAPQGAIEISTTSAAGCFFRGNLQLVALAHGGAVVPVPPGGLPGPTNGVYAPMPVDTVLAALSPGHSVAAQHSGQLLVVTVGGDASAASCAARDRQTRPAGFRLTIGHVVVTVANLDAAASDTNKQAIVGCPGRFYAGSATLQ